MSYSELLLRYQTSQPLVDEMPERQSTYNRINLALQVVYSHCLFHPEEKETCTAISGALKNQLTNLVTASRL